MPRTNVVNAFDDELSAILAVGATDMLVANVAGFPVVPFYVVLDPFEDALREYVLATAINGTADGFTVVRNLAGSVGDVEHPVATRVRVAIVAQHITDLWDGIVPSTPQTFLHSDLTDVSSDQHHIRYDDAEAIAAVGPHTPAFTPSNLHVDLTDVSPDQHHTKYTDAEAVTAVGPHLADAPSDGTPYSRQDAAWIAAGGGGGGGDFMSDGSVPMSGAIAFDNAVASTGLKRASTDGIFSLELTPNSVIIANPTGPESIALAFGRIQLTSPLAMGNNLITFVAPPIDGQDAANKAYVDAGDGVVNITVAALDTRLDVVDTSFHQLLTALTARVQALEAP